MALDGIKILESDLGIEKFIKWAEANNWSISTGNFNTQTLPDEISKRYVIPKEYQPFLMKIATCINDKQNKWFLCINDYIQKSEDEFRWNEYEIMSLEAAEDDAELKKTITDFWDLHFPFYMSVEGEYKYLAINVNDGSIVEGYEPEFEEPNTVAKSFDDFLKKVISSKLLL